MLAMVYEDTGGVYHRSGQSYSDWQHAQNLLQQSIILYKQLGEAPQGLVRAYFALGQLYLDMGDWKRALACYDDALPLINKERFSSQIAIELQLHIGDVYLEIGQWEHAHSLYERVQSSLESIKDRLVSLGFYRSLSETFLNLGNLELATGYADRCVELAQGPGDIDYQNQALAYRILGKVYYQQSNLNKAAHFLRASLDLYYKLGLWYKIGQTHYEMGLCDKLWEKGMAREHLQKAQEIFERLGAKMALEKAKQALVSA
jgi:tetratricopeptide (TPR) repeat protein